MQDVLPVGVGIVFRNLRLFPEDLINRSRNVEGIPLPLDRDILMGAIAGTGLGAGVGRFVTSSAAGRGFSVFSAGT